MFENLLKYSIVGVIIVIDVDVGENKVVIFFILNDNDNFVLDFYFGVIKLNVLFDRE